MILEPLKGMVNALTNRTSQPVQSTLDRTKNNPAQANEKNNIEKKKL